MKRILSDIVPATPGLSVREVRFDSSEGLELASRHSIAFPPAVIADGRLMGKGKILEEDLRRALGAMPLRSG